MLYTAKCFWPGVTEGELRLAAVHAENQTGERPPTAFRGALYLPGDELVLCLFDASSRAAVKRASERRGHALRARHRDRLGRNPADEKETDMPRLNCRPIVEVRRVPRAHRCRALAGSSGAHRPLRPRCSASAARVAYPTIQAAVDAAHDGDTIEIGPGVFAGGITITKSISLVGSGAGETIVRGGGPVITIGQSLADPTLTSRSRD